MNVNGGNGDYKAQKNHPFSLIHRALKSVGHETFADEGIRVQRSKVNAFPLFLRTRYPGPQQCHSHLEAASGTSPVPPPFFRKGHFVQTRGAGSSQKDLAEACRPLPCHSAQHGFILGAPRRSSQHPNCSQITPCFFLFNLYFLLFDQLNLQSSQSKISHLLICSLPLHSGELINPLCIIV